MISLLLSNPVEFIGWLLAFLVAIMSHEVAHGFAAMKNGDMTAKYSGRMNFNPLNHFDLTGLLMFLILGFGYAKPVPVDSRNFTDYKKGVRQVALAGVTTNLILATLAYPLYVLTALYLPDLALFDDLLEYFFLYLFFVNIWLMVFNLLPIYPLDGFRIVELYAPNSKYVSFMYNYSRYILLGYILLSVLGSRLGLPFFNVVSYLSNFVIKGISFLWGLIL